MQRSARLPESEVERGALEPPAAVRVQLAEALREAVDRVRAPERENGTGFLEGELKLLGVVRVLADALLAASAQVNDGRVPGELARDRGGEPLELIGVDLQRKVADELVGQG